MARYYVPKGRAIGNPNGRGVIRHGDPLPPLPQSAIDRFLADGSLAVVEEEVAPVGQEIAPAPEPERLPSIKQMPAFLQGKTRAEIEAIRARDGRTSPAAQRVYTDALAALDD